LLVRLRCDADDLAGSELEHALAREVDGGVRFDRGTRALYATDASNYRQVPIGLVVPRTVDALVAAVAVCREHAAPVLVRGGGTSLAMSTAEMAHATRPARPWLRTARTMRVMVAGIANASLPSTHGSSRSLITVAAAASM